MATNNFQLFNPNFNKALGDFQYTNNITRQQGVLGQLAESEVHNKLFAQCSAGVKAFADFVSNIGGYDAIDTDPEGLANNFKQTILDLLNKTINTRVPDVRASNTVYEIGDCVTDVNIPLWAELECIQAGQTTASAFVMPTLQGIGQQITDGAVIWALRAKRVKYMLNTPTIFIGKFSTTQFIGGLRHPIHPELKLPMLDCLFCDGTNGTIDMRESLPRCRNGIDSDNEKVGNDKFTLIKNNLPTDSFNAVGKASFEGDVSINESGAHAHGGYVTGFEPGGSIGGGSEYRELYSTASGGSHGHQGRVTGSVDINVPVKLNSGTVIPISTLPQCLNFAYIQRVY